MLKKETKKELMKKIAESLPVNLTEEQAIFWSKNLNFLSGFLTDLSKVVVSKQPQKEGR